MMKKLITILFLAFALSMSAETAKEVMNHLTNTLQRSQAMKIAFEMSSTNGQQTQGTMTLSGSRFVWVTKDLSTWFDGKTQWTYQPLAKEISITEPTDEEIAESNPLSILHSWSQHYTVATKSSNSSSYTLTLTPKVKGSDVKDAEVVISKGEWLPKSMVLTMANGVKVTIKVTSFHKLQAPSKSVFQCDLTKYPSATVIDLR